MQGIDTMSMPTNMMQFGIKRYSSIGILINKSVSQNSQVAIKKGSISIASFSCYPIMAIRRLISVNFLYKSFNRYFNHVFSIADVETGVNC